MNKAHHQNEIDQIQKHVKMLNIAGGIAICALSLAGVLLLTDTFESTAENVFVASLDQPYIYNTESATSDPENNASEEGNLNPIISESLVADKVNKTDKPLSARKIITFEEELQSFDASCINGAISFNWVTSGGSKYAYEIEKTYDQLSYEVFSRAPQPEKKDGKNVYSVEETAPAGDDAFYRLRKVVGKGKYEYSENVKVKCTANESQSATVDVFPNGNGSFRIMINTAVAGPFKVTLSDVNETELVTEEFLAREGNNEFILSSNSITRGNYVLRVSNDSMVKEKKVVLK